MEKSDSLIFKQKEQIESQNESITFLIDKANAQDKIITTQKELLQDKAKVNRELSVNYNALQIAAEKQNKWYKKPYPYAAAAFLLGIFVAK